MISYDEGHCKTPSNQISDSCLCLTTVTVVLRHIVVVVVLCSRATHVRTIEGSKCNDFFQHTHTT